MKVLIVYAHMEKTSFTRAMLDVALATLKAQGHETRVSDLYAEGFDPVARPSDFRTLESPDCVRYDLEQKHAVATKSGFAADIERELERVLWADLVIFQFPFYWFSVPAILKGWFDRVFVNGVVYGGGKWYDRGGLSGRRAMLAFSTGCYPSMCGPDGINGDMSILLWPIQNGILRFSGMTVLAPHIAYSVAYRREDERRAMLDAWAARLRGIDRDRPLPFHARAEFADDWRLRPGVTPRATGQMLGRTPSSDGD